MIFPYSTVISGSPGGREFALIRRPEIPLTVIGPSRSGSYLALVDTGSDNTILPKSIADYLGIVLHDDQEESAVVFGGHRVPLLRGAATLELTNEGESLQWRAEIGFFEFDSDRDECLILGHSGFLEYFTAIFDGDAETLTLVANDRLPTIPPSV